MDGRRGGDGNEVGHSPDMTISCAWAKLLGRMARVGHWDRASSTPPSVKKQSASPPPSMFPTRTRTLAGVVMFCDPFDGGGVVRVDVMFRDFPFRQPVAYDASSTLEGRIGFFSPRAGLLIWNSSFFEANWFRRALNKSDRFSDEEFRVFLDGL